MINIFSAMEGRSWPTSVSEAGVFLEVIRGVGNTTRVFIDPSLSLRVPLASAEGGVLPSVQV